MMTDYERTNAAIETFDLILRMIDMMAEEGVGEEAAQDGEGDRG